jgi:hypothetical protein
MKLREVNSPYPWCRAFLLGECKVLVGIEDGKWHLSISHDKRLPTYWEVKAARYRLCPDDKHMAMIFPPQSQFVNIHDNCLHLFEIEGDKLVTESTVERPKLKGE